MNILRAALIIVPLWYTVVFSQPQQKERWIYRNYDLGWGTAYSIAYGLDYNLYIAGVSDSGFTVISTDTSGNERWAYTYNSFGYVGDDVKASSIAYGADGNIYACGVLQQSYSDKFMYVVSLNSSGQKRWDYMPAYYSDAKKILYGGDGNIYVAADSLPGMTDTYIQLYSFNASGNLRWVYTYTPSTNANSVVYGTNGYVYVTGQRYNQEFMVLAVDNSGHGKWSYFYDYYGNALSIAYGNDWKVYAAGYTNDGGWPDLFTVIALDDTSGLLEWMTRASGTYTGAYSYNRCYSITMGSDGNVYASGFLEDTSYSGEPQYRFYVVSLQSVTGDERWQYEYDYNQESSGTSHHITNGSGEYLYACGYTDHNDGRGRRFTVIKFSEYGDVDWIYQKRWDPINNPDLCAYYVIEGLDGYLYSAGTLGDSTGGGYFSVVALDTQLVGIKENPSNPDFFPRIVNVNTIFNDRIDLRLRRADEEPLTVILYNICGSPVFRKTFSNADGLLSIDDRRIETLTSGVYFLKAITGVRKTQGFKLIKFK